MLPLFLATLFALQQVGLTLASPTTIGGYKQWNPIGCWGDSTSARALRHLVAVASRNMTVESCLDSCAAGGYILGGLEYGDECYCGNTLLYMYGSSESCDMPCSGNASEVCGGPKSLDLYQVAGTQFTTGPPSTVWSYKRWNFWGCAEEVLPRLLPHGPLVPIPGEQMTVERCLDGCAAAGYDAAGLEAGQECFCDLVARNDGEPPRWESTTAYECFYPCLGNATEVCGGLSTDGMAQARLSTYWTCNYSDAC
ncbi:WSC domain-containing protein [Mycena sanguinolenta]|nr:WSC domain-containing protein [Mycena sanguinolenta]